MKKGTISYIITAFLGAFLIFADQFTKYLIVKNVSFETEAINVIDNFFAIVNWHNTGSAWGLMSNLTTMLSILSVVCACAILFFYVQADSGFLKLCLMLLTAGALGNAIDRIRLGYVVDFLDFYNLFGYAFPAFNVADICVCAGCIGFIIYMMFLAKKHPPFRENTLASKIKF